MTAQKPGTQRTVGSITYELTRKRVKNLNLRVGEGGAVRVSAPARTPLREIDRFVASHEAWIEQAQERVRIREEAAGQVQDSYTPEQMEQMFRDALYAAGFVKNPYYELYNGTGEPSPEVVEKSKRLSDKSLTEITGCFADALLNLAVDLRGYHLVFRVDLRPVFRAAAANGDRAGAAGADGRLAGSPGGNLGQVREERRKRLCCP